MRQESVKPEDDDDDEDVIPDDSGDELVMNEAGVSALLSPSWLPTSVDCLKATIEKPRLTLWPCSVSSYSGVCLKRVLSLLLPSLDLHRRTRPSVRCARQSSNLSPSKSKALDAKDKAARRRAEKDAAALQLQGKRAQLSKVKVRPGRFLSVARARGAAPRACAAILLCKLWAAAR
jgi:hypothetical protein